MFIKLEIEIVLNILNKVKKNINNDFSFLFLTDHLYILRIRECSNDIQNKNKDINFLKKSYIYLKMRNSSN